MPKLKQNESGGINFNRHNRGIIYGKTEGRCIYCGKWLPPFSRWHIDHLIPKKCGGLDTLENLWPACARCNIKKGGLSFDDFRNAIIERALLRTRRIEDALVWLQESQYFESCEKIIGEMADLLGDLRKAIKDTPICFLIDSLIERQK